MIVVARAAFMPPCKVLMWQWVSFNCRGWNPKLQQWRRSEVSKQRHERPANTSKGSRSSCHRKPSVSPDLKRIFFREAAKESSRAPTPLRIGCPSFAPTFWCKSSLLFLTNFKKRNFFDNNYYPAMYLLLQVNGIVDVASMPKVHSETDKQNIFSSQATYKGLPEEETL